MTEKERLPEENYRGAVEEIAGTFFMNKENTTTLYIIRHGQDAVPTKENNYDQPLTPLGISRAHLVGKRLKKYGITQLISSPMLRTSQTADIIASYIGLPNQPLSDLREIKPTDDFVNFAKGLFTISQLWKASNLNSAGYFNKIFWPATPGIESGKELRSRAKNIIEAILDKYAGQKIAVVSHYAFINAYISEMLRLEGDGFFFIQDTGISVVKAYQGYRALISLNDSSHIDEQS